jgi:predicted GH43/DUF377 family glycosyl hydrolase
LLLRIAERPANKPNDEQIAPILDPETGRINLLRVKNDDPDLEVPDPRIFYYKNKMYLTSISHLRIALSDDGINFEIDPAPAVFPQTDYETYGLEDPRITQIGELFYISYKVVSQYGIATGLLTTTDFKEFKRHGIIFCPENIDVVLFGEKIGGKFYALTRPVPCHIGPRGIWLASSSDAINWGGHRPLILPRPGGFDGSKTGGSCVPIRTDDGWLVIYHGSDEDDKYSLAAALLDIDDPSKVIAIAEKPLMQPEADYEVKGFYGNVVFACGAITAPDGTVTIYYGASDESTAAATTTVAKILSTMK